MIWYLTCDYRRAFYSEGEELGFMMYAYLVTFTKPSLEGYACYTESMALAGMRPYIPFPQEKSKYSVNPTVSVNNRHLRFTIRADYICEKKGTSKPFTGVAASESDAGYIIEKTHPFSPTVTSKHDQISLLGKTYVKIHIKVPISPCQTIYHGHKAIF